LKLRTVFLACCSLHVAVALAQPRQLYFGDTHVHTAFSEDAYALGRNEVGGPDIAFRWAKGLPVAHPYTGVKIQSARPLDFLVVADHAYYLGIYKNVMSGRPGFADTATGRWVRRLFREMDGDRNTLWNELNRAFYLERTDRELNSPAIRARVWRDYIAYADDHNEPGHFTAFIGWEWTASPRGNNLHRVVMTDADAANASSFLPLSVLDSEAPEDLWLWLDKTHAETGASFVAIPHNSNISNGRMFPTRSSDGRPISAEYSQVRQRWEPLVEITQIKGDSEAHPRLSPGDPFAAFEKYEHLLKVSPDSAAAVPVSAGDYVRPALLRGLQIKEKTGVNPYNFGVIGSTDSHASVSSVDENNFWGKFPTDALPGRGMEPIGGPLSSVVGWAVSASGLAAVWAQENTRQSLLSAFQRKEAYATTGPRIAVRVFAGWDFTEEDARSPDISVIGYRRGVPMGGDLGEAASTGVPTFLIQVAKDPTGANLERVQVIKGWRSEDGELHEKVIDVALSDGRIVDPHHTAPPIDSTVDVRTARYTNERGAAAFNLLWKDESFDATQHSFYYLRVLEIPTPRHSLYDSIALGIDPPAGFPATIQERAYTSPIFYTP
jgi:hypothetical protein